jgi:acyl-CoA synthetase (AMP-forming)/AMP-acid ligase II
MRTDGLCSLIDLLHMRAETSPDRRVYTFLADGEIESDTITFKELELRSHAIASLLERRHKAGERAILLYPPGLDFIAAFLGCLCAGVVAVPAYPPRLTGPERWGARLQSIVRDAEASIVLCNNPIAERFSDVVHAVPDLKHARWLPTSNVPLSEADYWKEPEIAEDALAFLQYTSGSTAEPKGVMVSHGNLLHNLAYAHYVEGNSEETVSVSWLPVYHDMGLIEGVLQPLFGGYTAYLMAPAAFLQRPLRWLRAIDRYRATHSGGPNFAFDLCIRKTTPEERKTLDLSSWRFAYNGAEPIRWETLERFYVAFRECGFRWRSFRPVYGLAEATLVVSSGRGEYEPRSVTICSDQSSIDQITGSKKSEKQRSRITSCGPFWCGTRVVIAHPETGEQCMPGEIGEIWVQSKSIAQGYWNRPEETRRVFQARLVDDGKGLFLRTGDLGLIDHGELIPIGRIKDIIIIRGRKHYPQDIEHTVSESHSAVRAGCIVAFGIYSESEERLAVVAEVDRHHLRNLARFDEVFAAMREKVVNEHEIPPHAMALLRPGQIPKTSSGKLMRSACRAAFLGGTLHPIAQWVPATGILPEGIL